MSFDNPQARVMALEECYRDRGGDYLAQSTSPGKGWDKDFKDFEIPKNIERKNLFESFKVATESKNSTDRDWETVFVWTMAWGYGPGFGAYRTNQIRNHNKFHVVHWMKELSEIVNNKSESSVEDAYKWLKDDWGKAKKGLGPAFATKLLYVLSPERNRAPIIDAVVSAWLKERQIEVTSKYFDIDGYLRYVKFADDSLESINVGLPVGTKPYVDRGLIEYLIFQDELFERGKVKRVAPWRQNCQNPILKTL